MSPLTVSDAPQAPLVLLDGEQDAVHEFFKKQATDPTVGILCYDEEKELLAGQATLFPVGAREDLAAQAKHLFAALREADKHPHLKKLYAHLPPKTGLGLALYNRCIRAAAHTVEKID